LPRTPRTTKKLAQRIDLNYFLRPHSFRRWRFWLSAGLPLLTVAVIAWWGFTRDSRVYSSGRLAPAHAILNARCDICHVKTANTFRAAASDQACLACHDGPIHHADQVFSPHCSSCHVEHRGVLRLSATSDAGCTRCHADLKTTGAPVNFSSSIESFSTRHPEFAAVRPGSFDPATIKLNHAVHMKTGLRGPNGLVQMDCSDCHRTPADKRPWRFALAESPAAASALSGPLAAQPARAYMAPVTYARSCGSCHPLTFDKRFTESVPHDKPEVVHAFLVGKFQRYIAANPAELRSGSQPVQNLPGKPVPPAVRSLSPSQWVNERVAESEQLLWNKTCKECHALNFSPAASLPVVAKSNVVQRWFPHAVFSHDQHRLVTCTSCHVRALTSQETAEILLPGIHTCRQCHHSGPDAAESRCFECHTYHDWSKRKEVKGKFTLPELLGAAEALQDKRDHPASAM
jgi:hypothetical protein